MDWYSWLSKSSGLDRCVAYDYSLLLFQNELEEDDIAYFDHEFLTSMGVAVAKHRLEILKLAKNHGRRRRRPAVRPVSALLAAIHKACNRFTRYVHDLVDLQSKAVMKLPTAGRSGRSAVSSLMRMSRKLPTVKQGRLLITDVAGSAEAAQTSRRQASRSMNRMVMGSRGEGQENGFNCIGFNDTEQRRWDCMFQDLKPT